MLIYQCDKCGAEKKISGVVTNMYKRHGYEELSIKLPGDIKDVCKNCYHEILNAKNQADREDKKSKKARMLEILDMQ